MSRVDVVAVVTMIAALHWPVSRRFGGIGSGWIPRIVRLAGFAAVLAFMVAKSDVERVEFARLAGHPSLSGLWAGEVLLLVVLAAYVTGLLAITSRRTPANTSTVAVGVGGGVVIGLAIYGLRPLADQLHVTNPWLAALDEIGKVLAVPLVLCACLAAVIVAARRTSTRTGQLKLTDTRARQGVAAGACVGVAAALIVSVLGIATIALIPHAASGIQWTLPGRNAPAGTVYHFEVGISEAAAGYLLVLIIFPLLGAGLGAWGGLFAAGNSGLRGDGGDGGGGPDKPRPDPAPPGGNRRPLSEPKPALLDLATLLALPEWDGRATPVEPTQPSPEHTPERVG
jgi:hypothetical protein